MTDCPKGKVQVEFVNCQPKEKNGEYGWKPADYASIEAFVDGIRFRIELGNISGINAGRGIRIYHEPYAKIRKAVNAIDVILDESGE